MSAQLHPLKRPVPFNAAGFAAATKARPDLHPAQAVMRGLSGGIRPSSLAQLEQRRADCLRMLGPEYGADALRAIDKLIAVAKRGVLS